MSLLFGTATLFDAKAAELYIWAKFPNVETIYEADENNGQCDLAIWHEVYLLKNG